MWLACPLFLLLVQACMCDDEPTLEEEITAMLYDAAGDVLATHSRRRSNPPAFNMPDDFMRSFQPGTGVGNREELKIKRVDPVYVFADAKFSRFLFQHFNSTDYLAGVSDKSMVLYKINASSLDYIVMPQEDVVLSLDFERPITDVVLYTRYVKNLESLYVAIGTEDDRNSVIYVYEIIGDSVKVATTTISIYTPVKKISYVQSTYGGCLAFLTDTVDKKELVYSQRGNWEVNNFIEVKFPSAVDFVTFTVHGRGFIAVADHEYCDIFKLDHYAGSHMSFDRLGPFSGIVDLEYFRLGIYHYLTVVDSEGHHLYTWKKGEFSLKQRLEVPGVAQAFAAQVESCRDEVILMTVTKDQRVYFHVFNGQTEKFETLDTDIADDYRIKPGSIASFSYQDTVVVLFVDNDNEEKALMIQTSLVPMEDPLLVEGRKVSETMKNLQATIKKQNEEIKRIKGILKDAVRKTGTQYISSVQHFSDLTASNGTEVEKINDFEVKWEDSSFTVEEYKKGTKELEGNVGELERLVGEIEKKMEDVVRLDEEGVIVITGKKVFTGQVSADTLVATSLNLPEVAGMNLAQIQDEVYRLDNPDFIQGTLTFQQPLSILGDLHIQGTMNGIDISKEVMTTNTEQTSDADMIFTNQLTINGDLDVYETVNGIDISEDVVTLSKKHRIRGRWNFLNGIEATSVRTARLDGVDVDDLFQKAFTMSGNQTLLGEALFSSVTTNNIILNGHLNGYDVGELANNIVRTDRSTTITEFKNFVNDVVIDGDLTVTGTVNGLRIPDDLVLTDRSQVITGSKEFAGEVTANVVDMLGKVDGLKIPEDIVTLSGDEEISSTLYFADGIDVKKNIIVEGLVDGQDISEVAKQAIELNRTHEFDEAAFISQVTITGNLNVGGLINNVDLNKILGDIVYRDEPQIEIKAKKYFRELSADHVLLDGTINGFNILLDFMNVDGDQNITGTKTFRNVTFNSLFIEDGMIDGVNIDDLYKRKLQIKVEDGAEVNEQIEFLDDVVVEDLTVDGTIDGLRIPEDILLSRSDQQISNKKFAGRVVVDTLMIDGDLEVEDFNGQNLNEFYANRVTLSDDQIIDGDVWFGNITAEKVSVSGLVNGFVVSEFAENIMSKTKPQIVTAVKEFSGDVFVMGDIHTKGVNGFDLADIQSKAFKLLEPNEVTAHMEFEDNVTFNSLVTGEINGVNLTRLSEDSLKKSASIQYVQGEVVFEKGFDVTGDITATSVNGLVLKEDVLLKTIPQTIKGQFTFDTVGISGDLNIGGDINGLDLSEVYPKLARIDDTEIVIESDITFTSDVHVTKDIEVTGMVNNVNLKDLFSGILRKTGDQVVTGHKEFLGNVTILGDVDVKTVNGIPWKEFLNDVVWINTPQEIHSPKTFTGDVSVLGRMYVSGIVNAAQINGKNWLSFLEDVVFIDEPTHITGPIVFKHSVEIVGNMNADLINGLNLKTDVITLACTEDAPQRITGQKTFSQMKVYGNIVTASVNSRDLQELYFDTLLVTGNQNVTGHKTIYGDVTFKRNVYPNLVNGMNLSTDLVTLHTEQTIKGPLRFQGDVFVEDLLIGENLNGMNILNLKSEAVYLGTDQKIEGSYTFQHAKALSNVEVDGLVNGVDLKSLDKNVTLFLEEAQSSITAMEEMVQEHCELASELQKVLEYSYYSLDSFVTFQELDFMASFIKAASSQNISLVYLNDATEHAISVNKVWDKGSKMFKTSNFSLTVIAKSSQYRIKSIVLTINIGVHSKDSSVVLERAGYSITIEKEFLDASAIQRKTDIVVALLFPYKRTCKIYFVKDQANKAYTFHSVDVGKESKSIALFETSEDLYLAVASSYSTHGPDSKVYANSEGKWLVQQIHTRGSLVRNFAYHDYHYLVFTNDAPVHESKEPKSLQVYRNSGSNGKFVLFQKVSFDDTRGMATFEFGDSSQMHLVAWNATVIQIFVLEGESGFKELVTIHGDCVKDVKPLFIEKDLYLVVGQQNLNTAEAVKSVVYKGKIKGVKYDPYEPEYCSWPSQPDYISSGHSSDRN